MPLAPTHLTSIETPRGMRTRCAAATVFRAMCGTCLVLGTLAGCRGASSPGETFAARSVTYAKDVAPILFKRCAPCHRPGGSAPFSVLSYDSVRQHARQIVVATDSRVMPPWLPEPGYARLAGERRLTTEEIVTIGRWVDEGTREGNAADLPSMPQFSEGWQLGEPDLTVKLPRPFTLQAGGQDVWRNFVVPIPVTETRYVKTVELRPGAPGVVHHALMAIDEMRSSRRRDEQDAEPGFEGMDMGDAHMPDGSLLGWTPGMLPFPGIEGAAWRLKPATDLVLQLHMVPSGKPEVIDPAIGFHFAETKGVGTPTYVLMLDADDRIDIPGGSKEFVVTDSIELPVDAEALAVYPHAHYIGKAVEAWATRPDGTVQPLIRIDRWDFKWQDVYRYAQPISLRKGTSVSMRWTYDNSADNVRNVNHPPKRVLAGNRSADEMAHVQLQLRLRSPGDRLLLQEAYFQHLNIKDPRSAKFRYGLAGVLKDLGRFSDAVREYRLALTLAPGHVGAHINLGSVLMQQGLIDEAIRHFRAAIQVEPSSSGAYYNLGVLFGSQGRLDEAARHYREALRHEPEFAEAHNNLGQVLSAQGKLDEAIVHYRQALRLLPDSADVENNLGSGLLAQGKVEEADTHLRRALDLDPGHVGARENLSLAVKRRAGGGPRIRP